ncbi:MAG: helix-turn-helix transcriptional regulator [Defluviitaleaceae bacterium]|nr:helix-turn-helix transcriptional regulator [Defluviitaleaceae bacterium]
MKIGVTIKQQRKKKDVTQEKLAEYLGITYQAVSKWENGTALPDITLIVPLANYFGVSVDCLFSFEEDANAAKAQEYLTEYQKLLNIGDIPACVTLLRKALAEYPRNFNIMQGLAKELGQLGFNDGNTPIIEFLTEAITLAERVLEDCTDEPTRHNAIQTLCFAYRDIGQKEKAVALAKKIPPLHRSADFLLGMILDGDEKVFQMQKNIETYTDEIGRILDYMPRDSQFALNIDEKIICIETAINLYKTIFYDENYLFYHIRLTDCFFKLAAYNAEKNPKIAIHHLLAAEKHLLASEGVLDKTANYTTVFLNKCTHEPANTCKSFTDSERELFIKNLDRNCFKPLHENIEFLQLKNRFTMEATEK